MNSLIFSLCTVFFASFAQAHDTQENSKTNFLKFMDGRVQARTTWVDGPHRKGDSILLMEWQNATDGSPIEAPGVFRVQTYMRMEGGGHPGRTPIVQPEAGLGVYKATKIRFSMSGGWEMRLFLTLPNGKEEMQFFEFQVGDEHDHAAQP